MFLAVAFAYACGFYSALVTGSKDTLFSFYFYGLEDGSDTEFYINMTLQIVFAIFFTIGNVCMESVIFIIENAFEAKAALIEADLRSFGKDLEARSLSTFEKKEKLVKILKDIHLINDWNKMNNDAVFLHHFSASLFMSYTIGFCILCQYMVRLI